MILQALTAYYEALAAKGEMTRPGWSKVKISFALKIGDDGTLVRALPLRSLSKDGKKMIPRLVEAPAAVRRTGTTKRPNFLWDNSSYLLGIDGKNKPARALECFLAAKEYHLSLLHYSPDPFARAVCAYFEKWKPESALSHPALADALPEILKGANLIFSYNGQYPAENAALRSVWQAKYEGETEGERMRCLVTGSEVVPESIHPAVMNLRGGLSSGMALVSFNESSNCSYGRKQNLNAPVGRYAAFAYTTALNLLLSDKAHYRYFGDTAMVFWTEDAREECARAWGDLLDGQSETMDEASLESFMEAVSRGQSANWDGIPVNPANRFYILGLSPNAARVSVRFFLRDTFGHFVKNIRKHYEDIRVAPDGRSKGDIPLWLLLRETVNMKSNDKSPSPQMTGDTLRAILSALPYPATLYQQAQIRIRAEREISRGRMAIVKGCLSRCLNASIDKEALTVELNDRTEYQPYILGRVFAVLESIQQAANQGINTTIKDKYFTSACANPAVVFPTLLNLSQKHLNKLDKEQEDDYQKLLTGLMNRVTSAYPTHHSLYEQGVFQLGYYHQRQKLFPGKNA